MKIQATFEANAAATSFDNTRNERQHYVLSLLLSVAKPLGVFFYFH